MPDVRHFAISPFRHFAISPFRHFAANAAPLTIDKGATLEQVARILTSDAPLYPTDRFVIVENGGYFEWVTGES